MLVQEGVTYERVIQNVAISIKIARNFAHMRISAARLCIWETGANCNVQKKKKKKKKNAKKMVSTFLGGNQLEQIP